MQTQGTLAQTSLASLLEAMQSERATGTLSLSNGSDSASLYFLFGHLFHAAGDDVQGEEVVIGALGWSDGQFTFDPRAKLPAEETIKSATADLLAEAERRRTEAASNGAYPEVAAAGTTADIASAFEPSPGGTPVSAATAPGPATSWDPTTVTPAAEEPAGVALPAEPSWSPPAPTIPAGAPAGAAPAVFGNPQAEPLGELPPLPSGKPLYEGLKSAFVDFPKLLRTLDNDKLTGYVRLNGDDFSSVLLLHDGHVLEALFGDGRLRARLDAFQLLRDRMERGEGLLDVIELSGETVVALAQLLTAPPLFTGLLGRFINFDQLLEYLAEEKVDGSVVVAGGSETGVILLRKGAVHGAYTESAREPQPSPSVVSALAAERPSRIEVKAGAESPPGIDVAAALGGG